MTCLACNIHSGSFKTETDYLTFNRKLLGKIESGELKKIGQEAPSGPLYKFKYSCSICGACWLLSVPDQAFRGGWEHISCN